MTRLLLTIVAIACCVVLLVAYRPPRPPLDRLADRAAVAPGRPLHGAQVTDGPAGTAVVTGPQVAWPLGHLRVRVALAGRRIVEVDAVGMSTTNPLSQRRSRGAVQQLRARVLTSQCGDVDAVSGATYTSRAYLRSLQAALDAVHARLRCG